MFAAHHSLKDLPVTDEDNKAFRSAMSGAKRLQTEQRVPVSKPKPKAKARFTRADESAVLAESLEDDMDTIEHGSGGALRYQRQSVGRRTMRKLTRGSYSVQAEIDRALRSKVWLKSGGSIVINQTEALVAIDVNTGRYVGKKTAGRLEDTILKTNLEAGKEIIRQIRLRDLGGIIVVDFIDMEEKKNRQKVFQSVEQELRRDRAPSKALQVSDFGLVIITRKRVKQSLERVLTEPCPYCAGSAVIKSGSTICYEILSEVKKISGDLDGKSLVLRVNPDIARVLRDEERAVFKDLKQSLGREIVVRPDAQLHHEQFDLMAIG